MQPLTRFDVAVYNGVYMVVIESVFNVSARGTELTDTKLRPLYACDFR